LKRIDARFEAIKDFDFNQRGAFLCVKDAFGSIDPLSHLETQ